MRGKRWEVYQDNGTRRERVFLDSFENFRDARIHGIEHTIETGHRVIIIDTTNGEAYSYG